MIEDILKNDSMSNKLICIVGMTGSGKSVVSDYLVEKGFEFLRFGQITLDYFRERNILPTEAKEKEVREGFRKEHGMAAYAILNIPKIDELLKKGNVVGDGLYSWSEYKVLKEKYGENFYVIAVYAPPALRYSRLENRTEIDEKMRNRPTNPRDSKSRDYAEIENIEKGGPIAMADFTVINTSTVENARKQVDDFLSQIM